MVEAVKRKRANALLPGSAPMIGRHRSNALLPGSAPNLGRARANALLPGSTERPSNPNLGDEVKNRVVPAKSRLDNAYDKVSGKLSSANDWLEGKISSADKFVQDNTFGGQSKIFNGLLGAYDKAMNLKDDFHDWKKEKKQQFHDWKDNMSEKYHNSAVGKKLDSAGSWVKDKASAAGDWIKSKFQKSEGPGLMDKIKDKVSAAGDWIKSKYEGSKLQKGMNWVKGKASDAGDWIKSKYEGSALQKGVNWTKDKASAAGNWIKSKYEGSALQKGVNWTKDKASAAGNWIKSKFHSDGPGLMDKIKAKYEDSALQKGVNWVKGKAHAAGDWVKDKYEGSELQKGVNYAKTGVKNIKDWAVDKKERFEDFTDDMKDKFAEHNRFRRQSHKAEKKGAGYLNDLAAAKMAIRNGQFAKNISNLKDENYVMGAEQGEPQSEGFIKDKIADATANKSDLVKQGIKYGAKGVGKLAKKLMNEDSWEEYEDGITDGLGAVTSFSKAGANAVSAIGLKRMKDEQITAGAANDTQAANLRHAQSAMFNEQKRGAIKNAFSGVGKTISAASSFGGPVVSTGGKIVGKITGAVGNAITGSMKASEDKHIAQESVFGDLETYKMFKKQFPNLSTEDIQDLIAEETNSRDMSEVANRNKMVWAQDVKNTTGKGQGGHNMLKKRGYTDKGIQRITNEQIGKEMGVDMSERTMRRRLKRNQN